MWEEERASSPTGLYRNGDGEQLLDLGKRIELGFKTVMQSSGICGEGNIGVYSPIQKRTEAYVFKSISSSETSLSINRDFSLYIK